LFLFPVMKFRVVGMREDAIFVILKVEIEKA